MATWLVKTEPESYGWDDLVRDGGTEWDGVRNHAAARHLRSMAVGDRVLVYHSGAQKAAVGIAEVARAARPDGDGGWVSVRIAPVRTLPSPVPLAAMRADPALAGMAMLRQPRLSVSPLAEAEWRAIADRGCAVSAPTPPPQAPASPGTSPRSPDTQHGSRR